MEFARQLSRSRRRFDALSPGLKGPRAYVNWAKANLQMLRRTSRIEARPLKLTIDPTNACQLRCPVCPTGQELQDRPIGHVDLTMFRRLMDEVGDDVFFVDFFNWGEPLLNKRISELIALAHAKRISTTVSTNFSLPLSDERLRALIDSGLNQLIVSMDGASKDTAGTYRRRSDFDLVIANMRRIVELKREMRSRTPHIVWRFLVFRFNEHELRRAVELARDIGVDCITFSPATLDEGTFAIPDADRRMMKDWVPNDPRLSFYDAEEAARARPGELRKKGPMGKVKNRCDWHYLSSAINSDGSVAPCCAMFHKKDDFGQLSGGAQGDYMSVVNNEKFVGIRDRFAGRRDQALGVSCETCPAPELMDYAKFLNLWIACVTFFGLVRAVTSPISAIFGRHADRPAGTQVKSPVPIHELMVVRS
jgi:MoaA/NifB/PqqE/SkfB family radical SAM enzyme